MSGGYRPGAGRKKGYSAKNAEEARRLLSEMVLTEIEPIAVALIKRAKEGDIRAAKELLDRAFGKTQNAVEDTPLPTPILVRFLEESTDTNQGPTVQKAL
jgi:hypothetical protein